MVLLDDLPPSIPKGSQRDKLKRGGRVVDVAFHRSMKPGETQELIQNAFKDVESVTKFQYLQGHQDNSLQVSDHQDLDGSGVINLAGCGSLYLQQINDEAKSNESEASCSHSFHSAEDQPHCSGVSKQVLRTRELIHRADELIRNLRVSHCLYLNVHFCTRSLTYMCIVQ